MSAEMDEKLVVAISSRALFDLDEANDVFVGDGLDAYRAFQIAREEEPLNPGTGFRLAKALLAINDLGRGELVEVVLVSRNDADTGLRVMNSAERHGLGIRRACFTGGRPPFGYLKPFRCDLFLSAHEADVGGALAAGFAAGLVYPFAERSEGEESREVRIAFDGDAVLFSPDAERTYREQGLAAFHDQERLAAGVPLEGGPFKGFLLAVHAIQKRFPSDHCPLRTALVTARSAPAHKRAVTTLRHWNVRIDEAYFLGGMDKSGVLAEFDPHIFFDDQAGHCERASSGTPTARVPDLAIYRATTLEAVPPPPHGDEAPPTAAVDQASAAPASCAVPRRKPTTTSGPRSLSGPVPRNGAKRKSKIRKKP